MPEIGTLTRTREHRIFFLFPFFFLFSLGSAIFILDVPHVIAIALLMKRTGETKQTFNKKGKKKRNRMLYLSCWLGTYADALMVCDVGKFCFGTAYRSTIEVVESSRYCRKALLNLAAQDLQGMPRS